jgi:hypothetical protein
MKPTVPTPSSLAATHRRRDRLNAQVDRVLAAMRRGACLHLSHAPRRHWRLSTGEFVTEQVARAVIAAPSIIDVGDTLLVGELSQTYRVVGK